MKEAVKKLLPHSVLNLARKSRDLLLLQSCPKLEFDAANLKKSFALDLNEADIAKDWERDAAAIAKIFSADNRAGGVNPGDRRALYYLVRALRPQNVLEIGTHIGASSLHIAMALASNGAGHLTTVDIINVNDNAAPWHKAGLQQNPAETMARAGVADRVGFIAMPSLSFMKNTKEKYDLIFLDGDHAASSVYREVAAALNLLSPGGIILLHDYYPAQEPLFADGAIISGPYQAVARIRCEEPAIIVKPIGDLPWPTKQGSTRTTLALLLKND